MKQTLIREYFEKNNGILNILPTFVPRRCQGCHHHQQQHLRAAGAAQAFPCL